MKEKLKLLLRWGITFLLCFLIIYLTVLFGGWKLFESGDPILIELGVALILSFFVCVINEVVTKLERRVKALEERLDQYENQK